MRGKKFKWVRSPCPEYRAVGKATGAHRTGRPNGCVFTLDSRPLYRNSQRAYSFFVHRSHNVSWPADSDDAGVGALEPPVFVQNFDAVDTYAHS